MKQLKKVLYKFNHVSLLKNKEVKQSIKLAQKELLIFQFKYPVKTLKDYFELSIIHKSLKQKQLLEDSYEFVRSDMMEVWNQLDFKQKNKFSNDRLKQVQKDMVHFTSCDKVIHICFFEPLINALYDHEMAVFELPQFNKLIHDFKKEFQSIKQYQLLPYKHGFTNERCVYENEQGIVLLNQSVHQLYFIDKEFQIEVVGLSNTLNNEELYRFIQLYLLKKEKECIQFLLESTLMHDKGKKKLEKILKKVKDA